MNKATKSKPRKTKLRVRDEIPVLSYLAFQFLKYGAPDKARALYALLASLQPQKKLYRVSLGYACFKCGKAEEALAHLENAFKGQSGYTGWQALLMSRVLRANGMVAESKELITGFMQEKAAT